MVAPKQNVGWDLAVDSAIQWTDNGYVDTPKWAMRHGLVRVNVMGIPSTVLRKKKEELGWSVTMQTVLPPKFGPQTIEIVPGFDGKLCFGSLYEVCQFDPLPSLKQASVQAALLCKEGYPGNETRVFRLSAAGKQDATLVVMDSGGSGGSSTTLTLSPIADRHACDKLPG
ncbi:hypothetical protein AWB74_08106 [Caballeronia arvi]|uniref:Uncharacterized protein n=2 Tax=Caballeronia arvi TaxID=1777135 RepID=A0A158L1Y9_9BURK|nr:hypothetical protein AWB74_08106 [Caballeronia arvi]